MARLILKSPYIKGGKDAGGHAKYIATRERVELVPDGRLATQKQAQLIDSLTKDFPDAKKLPEYNSYRDSPTKVNASVFITRALEDSWPDVQQSDIYAEYIATRPRVERIGSHGLFGDEDYVEAGGRGPPGLRQRQDVAQPAPHTPQRHRRRHEHPAQRVSLVRRIPR